MQNKELDALTHEIAQLNPTPIKKHDLSTILSSHKKSALDEVLDSGFVKKKVAQDFASTLKSNELELFCGIKGNVCVKENVSVERSLIYLVPLAIRLGVCCSRIEFKDNDVRISIDNILEDKSKVDKSCKDIKVDMSKVDKNKESNDMICKDMNEDKKEYLSKDKKEDVSKDKKEDLSKVIKINIKQDKNKDIHKNIINENKDMNENKNKDMNDNKETINDNLINDNPINKDTINDDLKNDFLTIKKNKDSDKKVANKSKNTLVKTVILSAKKQYASEIVANLRTLNPKITSVVAAGGTNLSENIKKINGGVDVVVGTTGRLYYLVESRLLTTSHLIIEDADLLLLPDTVEKFTKIVEVLRAKTTWVFASKCNPALRVFLETHLSNYKFFNLLQEPLFLKHFFILVEKKYKFLCLKSLLARMPAERTVIFCSPSSVRNLGLKLENCVCVDKNNEVDKNLETGANTPFKYALVSENNFDLKGYKFAVFFDAPLYAESYFSKLGRLGRVEFCVNFYGDEEMGIKKEIESRLGFEMGVVNDGCFE